MIKKQKNSFRLESPEPSFILFCYLNIGDNSHFILAESNRVEKSYSSVYEKMLFFHRKSFNNWPLGTRIVTFSYIFYYNSFIPINMILKKAKTLIGYV